MSGNPSRRPGFRDEDCGGSEFRRRGNLEAGGDSGFQTCSSRTKKADHGNPHRAFVLGGLCRTMGGMRYVVAFLLGALLLMVAGLATGYLALDLAASADRQLSAAGLAYGGCDEYGCYGDEVYVVDEVDDYGWQNGAGYWQPLEWNELPQGTVLFTDEYGNLPEGPFLHRGAGAAHGSIRRAYSVGRAPGRCMGLSALRCLRHGVSDRSLGQSGIRA